MALKSGISKRFRKEFVLDENALRRFHGILDKAAKDLTDPTEIIFHVEREDYRYYEVKDIDDLLSDPNVSGKEVMTVYIELRPSQSPMVGAGNYRFGYVITEWIVQIMYQIREYNDIFAVFDSSATDIITLRIASEDKNWALLLSDELDTQINRTLKTKAIPGWALATFVIPFGILSVKFGPYLNQLNLTALSVWHFVAFCVILITMIMLVMAFVAASPSKPTWFKRTFGPESTFLWGDEVISYKDRENIRQNILWTVVVGSIVSLISSVILALMSF
jgi:hypothetical protein